MTELITIIALLAAWNWGYWIGKRQRDPDVTWDWRRTALNQGWVNKLHVDDPEHYDECGRLLFDNVNSYQYWYD